MFETELKFQVPASRWAALQRAVATSTVEKTRLQALYVETEGHDLAAAGLALRLRKEGRVWVQTLKGRGDGLMQRLEHEVRLPAQRGLPTVDPDRHEGTPAGTALRAALDAARTAGRSDELRTLYRTDIQRLHRRVRHGAAVVEIALDLGHLYADGAPGQAPRRLAVAEIEFELVNGPPSALAALAARWAARHSLWWDVRTKSERGFRLALDRLQVPATKAGSADLPPGEALAPVLAAMLQSSLSQALPNLAEIAGAPAEAPAPPEHLHQLRVALRRLRTALGLFAHWAPEPAAAGVPSVVEALEERWADVFGTLGAARDADVLAAVWKPRLQAAGAPSSVIDAIIATDGEDDLPDLPDLPAQLRDPAMTVLLLDTLALCLDLAAPALSQLPRLPHSPDSTKLPRSHVPMLVPDGVHPPRAKAAQAVLRKAWQRAWSDARQFGKAPVELQHRARKRLKRLRYAAEFVAPLLPAKVLKRWQRVLAGALSALGDYNDLQTAREHYGVQVEQQPQAWFALGWLTAQDPASRLQVQKALKRLKACPQPWRKA